MSKGEVEYYYDRREQPYYDDYGIPHSERQYADTLFKQGESRTVEAARKGGLKSGETRRIKAEKKAAAKEYAADFLYDFVLDDVTEEELREFIRWRGQQKRKATLAKIRLEQDSEDRQIINRTISEYLKEKEFTHFPRSINKLFSGIWQTVTFTEAKSLFYQTHNYEIIGEVIREFKRDIKRCLNVIYSQ